MKKMAVYFTDRQTKKIEALAAYMGITFAEALRRILDASFDAREEYRTFQGQTQKKVEEREKSS